MPTKTKRSTGPTHHKHTKPYLQAYWPYLPVILLVIGLVLGNNWYASKPRAVLGKATDISIRSLLENTNKQRVLDNEASLNLSPQLADAAAAKAQDMVSRNYWSHSTPDNRTPWTFIDATGYNYQKAGENLAYGFADSSSTIAGWMNSAAHRANILNAAYKEVGFGIASSDNFKGTGPETVVVALYATPKPSNSAAVLSASYSEAPQTISRLQILTGGKTPWITTAAIIGSAGLVGYLGARQSKRLRKQLLRSEHAVMAHPAIDIGVILLVVALYFLTRTAGIIR